jgi:hypothetical protein
MNLLLRSMIWGFDGGGDSCVLLCSQTANGAMTRKTAMFIIEMSSAWCGSCLKFYVTRPDFPSVLVYATAASDSARPLGEWGTCHWRSPHYKQQAKEPAGQKRRECFHSRCNKQRTRASTLPGRDIAISHFPTLLSNVPLCSSHVNSWFY